MAKNSGDEKRSAKSAIQPARSVMTSTPVSAPRPAEKKAVASASVARPFLAMG